MIICGSMVVLSGCASSLPAFLDKNAKTISRLIQEGKLDDADQKLDRSLQQHPTNSRYLLLQFTLLIHQKKRPEAVQIWQQLPRRFQQMGLTDYVTALIRSVQIRQAEEIITTNITEHADSAQWHDFKGQLLYVQGKYTEAIAEFDQSISLDATVLSPFVNKALSLAELGKYSESLSMLENALKTYPDDALLWYNAGTVLSNLGYQQRYSYGTGSLGYFSQALRYFLKSYELDPTNTQTIVRLGITYFDLGSYTEAQKIFSIILSSDPMQFDAWYYLGMTYKELGQIDTAIQTFTDLLAVNPEYDIAREELDAILSSNPS